MNAKKEEETFAVTGVDFDELMRRALKLRPPKLKKKSRPKKGK